MGLAGAAIILNIHEFQGKALFHEHGIAVQKGIHATNVEDAVSAWNELDLSLIHI